MESRIDQLITDIDATKEYLYKNNPFIDGDYSSYNPDTGLTNTTVYGEPIGKGLTNKSTMEPQAFNKISRALKRRYQMAISTNIWKI